MKPLPADHRHRLRITGDELRELRRYTWAMAEAFGLDRKIDNYKGSRPITLYRWDLECIMDVIDQALKDERACPDRSSAAYPTLKKLGERLWVGNVKIVPPSAIEFDINQASWLKVCRQVYRSWSRGDQVWPRGERVQMLGKI